MLIARTLPEGEENVEEDSEAARRDVVRVADAFAHAFQLDRSETGIEHFIEEFAPVSIALADPREARLLVLRADLDREAGERHDDRDGAHDFSNCFGGFPVRRRALSTDRRWRSRPVESQAQSPTA